MIAIKGTMILIKDRHHNAVILFDYTKLGTMILIKDRHKPLKVYALMMKIGNYDTYKGSTRTCNR